MTQFLSFLLPRTLSVFFFFHFSLPPHFSLYFFLISSYRFRSFHLNANFGSIDRNELNKFLWKTSAAKMVAAKMADIEIKTVKISSNFVFKWTCRKKKSQCLQKNISNVKRLKQNIWGNHASGTWRLVCFSKLCFCLLFFNSFLENCSLKWYFFLYNNIDKS